MLKVIIFRVDISWSIY